MSKNKGKLRCSKRGTNLKTDGESPRNIDLLFYSLHSKSCLKNSLYCVAYATPSMSQLIHMVGFFRCTTHKEIKMSSLFQ